MKYLYYRPKKYATKGGEKIWRGHILDGLTPIFSHFPPCFSGLQGGEVIKSVLGGGVWKFGLGGRVHNPDPLRAQVWV